LNFDLFETLPDPAISQLVDAVARPGSRVGAVEVRHWGGAMARPVADASPVGHRSAPLSVIVEGPVEAAEALAPYATGGTFLNFLREPSRVESAYTPGNYEGLRAVKARLDPDNVLSANHNITPTYPPDSDRGLAPLAPLGGNPGSEPPLALRPASRPAGSSRERSSRC
ncbi:MAG TPA: BBE domain-containing protein, partial [Jatrophihabitantaceae bacterium]